MLGAAGKIIRSKPAAGGVDSYEYVITEGSSGLNFDGFSDGTGMDAIDQPSAGSIDVGTLDGSTIHQVGTDNTLGAIFYFFVEGDWTDLIDEFEIVGDVTVTAGTGTYDAGEDRTRWNVGHTVVAQWNGSGTTTVIVHMV